MYSHDFVSKYRNSVKMTQEAVAYLVLTMQISSGEFAARVPRLLRKSVASCVLIGDCSTRKKITAIRKEHDRARA